MSPVAFLCGACKRPLWVAGAARGTLARCGACGASCMVPADAPHLAEAPVSGHIDGAVPAELVDLAALPVITVESEKTLENQIISADSPLKTSGYNASDRGSFPWLALWMTSSFSILSAILCIYLVIKLRAADEALRKRGDSGHSPRPAMVEQKRGRINHLAFG